MRRFAICIVLLTAGCGGSPPTEAEMEVDRLKLPGAQPYTPARNEWLATKINATYGGGGVSCIAHYFDANKITIQIVIYAEDSQDLIEQKRQAAEAIKIALQGEHDLQGWDWLEIEIDERRWPEDSILAPKSSAKN